MHCALLHTQTAKHLECNEFVHCCMRRPQSIVFQIASIANTRMSLSHSRYLQCYLKICYIHGALWSGYTTIRNTQCRNSVDNLSWIRCIFTDSQLSLHKTHSDHSRKYSNYFNRLNPQDPPIPPVPMPSLPPLPIENKYCYHCTEKTIMKILT